jgi:hypothetical protein
MLAREKLKAIPLKSGTKHRYLLSPLLINTVLEVLSRAGRKQKKNTGIEVRKKAKLFLFADHMVLYKKCKESTKKLLELINKFSNA